MIGVMSRHAARLRNVVDCVLDLHQVAGLLRSDGSAGFECTCSFTTAAQAEAESHVSDALLEYLQGVATGRPVLAVVR